MRPFLPENFQFESPHWLWLLLLIPLLALLQGRAGRLSALRFSSMHLLHGLASKTRQALGCVVISMLFLSLACGVVAFAGPQSLHTEESVEESGVEIFFALDLSLSMSIKDMAIGNQKVDRLSVAKKVIRDFVRGRRTDRIGFVVFSGRPYLASPLTLDQDWLMTTLDRIGFNQTKDMGTAIGSALVTASKRLKSREAKSKTIILITDGANNSGKVGPIAAAEAAKERNIKIYTVAIGTEGYHVVPVPTPNGVQVGVRDQYDEETLKKVAATTGGKFFQARDPAAMEKIFKEIDDLEKTKLNIRRTTIVEPLYQWPLGAATAFALISLFLSQTVLRRNP
ncbi:MAG: VWA domain-containing protein [Verrucomicrobiaceae bacterium]|nr:MAG: VWA domain-containing protein [Verrucomicrobiaceae bacterium]